MKPKVSFSPDDKKTETTCQKIWMFRSYIVAILTPIVLIPVPIIINSEAGRCLYAILVMAVYWMTEVVPMAVTALLPIVFMPWFGIMDSKKICANYLKDANMLFLGGLMVAIAVEKWNLHKRVALRTLMLVGSEPVWIVFGFMGVTAFLSMWLSNTATTAMMVPIAHAVLKELGEHRRLELEQIVLEQVDGKTDIVNHRSVSVDSQSVGGARESSTSFKGSSHPDQSTTPASLHKSSASIHDPDTPGRSPRGDTAAAQIHGGGRSERLGSVNSYPSAHSGGGAPGPESSALIRNSEYAHAGGAMTASMMRAEYRARHASGMSGISVGGEEAAGSQRPRARHPSGPSGDDAQRRRRRYISAASIRETEPLTDPTADLLSQDAGFRNFSIALKMSIAYSANIGGTATLTGTGPNIVLKGQADDLYGAANHGINFSTWCVLALPNMLLTLLLAWLWLVFFFIGLREAFCRRHKPLPLEGGPPIDTASDVIRREYRKLGPMSFAEIAVLCHFLVLAILWLTRNPEFVSGWGDLLPKKYVTDASVAITVSAFLFIFPSRLPTWLCAKTTVFPERLVPTTVPPPLLDWATVNKQMPWSVILLLGGGFALAEACKESGLSFIIGDMLRSFSLLPGWGVVMLLSFVTVVITSFTSNIATATIFIPILAELGDSADLHPLYLMFAVTISASFAFVLPVSTPPNAIVFAYGDIRIIDMIKAGVPMSIICILALQLALNTWGYSYFNLSHFPDWARLDNNNNNTAAAVVADLPWSVLNSTTLSP